MLIHPRSWRGERTGRGRTEKQSWPLSWHVRSQPTSDPWVVLVLCPGLVWVPTQKSMKTDGSLCQCLWPKIGSLIKSSAIWYLKPDTGSSGLSMSLSPTVLHSTIQRRAKLQPDGSFSHPSHFQHGPVSPQHPFPQSVLNLCTKGLPRELRFTRWSTQAHWTVLATALGQWPLEQHGDTLPEGWACLGLSATKPTLGTPSGVNPVCSAWIN